MSRCLVFAAVVLVAAAPVAFAQQAPLALRYNKVNKHTYALTPSGMDWQTAQAFSRVYGGYLVAINDVAEQTFIQTEYSSAQAPCWIGLSDHDVEGLWKWDSGEPVLYANFCPNEPNNFGGVEDYVEIFPSYAGGAPCWNDEQSPYTGPGIAASQGIIELEYGDRVDFEGPATPCVCPYPAPLGATGNPEGISWNGASLGLPENPAVSSIVEEGMPVSGTQYLRVPAYGLRSVPAGGPLPRPVPPGINEVRIAIPPGTKGISLAWDYIKKHSVNTGINDGCDISVVDAAGALIVNVVYADIISSPSIQVSSSFNSCGLGNGPHVDPPGPQTVSMVLPPLPYPSYLSLVSWNDVVNLGPSVLKVDAIQFWGAGKFRLDITAPTGPGSIQLQNTGGGAGNTYWTAVTLVPGSFPFGWLFGLDITPNALFSQVGTGAPFSGMLNAAGTSTYTVPNGVPSGLPVYAISLQFAPGSFGGSFVSASAPEAFVTP